MHGAEPPRKDPMKIYVQISGDGAVTAFSTCSTADVQVEAEVTGPLYPEKISGYKLEPDNTGVNCLVFDDEQYKAHIKASTVLSLMMSSIKPTSSRNRKQQPLPKQKTDWPKSAGMPCWPVWMMIPP